MKAKTNRVFVFQHARGQVKAGSVLSHPVAYPLTTIEPGIAHGRLLGGNLSMLAATMGTPFEMEAEGVILFIEDINEPLYRIDRLLTHLRLAGTLGKLRGVLVGDVAGVDTVALERCSSRPSNRCGYRCWPDGAAGIAIRT